MEDRIVREILLRKVSGEGWYTIVQQGNYGERRTELARLGPTKNKPGNQRMRQLQFRYFDGHGCDVIVEE